MRWSPRSEDELRDALQTSASVESHYVDVKREIPSGPKGNTALAVDLASFAVDSGTVIVGVGEHDDEPLSPVPLAGLKERVDQVARSRVDPPLSVTCFEIASARVPGQGYLVIEVPASPEAPRMVDNIYRGRGDTTNIKLGDAEVRRIRARRAETEINIGAVLRREIERDPAPSGDHGTGHLFVVAEPIFTPTELLVEFAGQNWQQWLQETFRTSASPLTPGWDPDIRGAVVAVRTPDGWALRNWRGARESANDDGNVFVVELQVNENGGLRLFCSRASSYTGGLDVMSDSLIFGYARRVVDWAIEVSDLTGFAGNWRFGLGITRLKGALSWTRTQRVWGDVEAYATDEYIGTGEATLAELRTDPNSTVGRLTNRLNRTLAEGQIPLPTGG